MNRSCPIKRLSKYLLLLLSLALAGCNPPLESISRDDPDASLGVPATAIPDIASPPEEPPAATAALPAAEPVRDKWDWWTSGVRLRGANIHPCWTDYQGECVQYTTRQDVQELRDLGANLINVNYPGVFSEQSPYEVSPTNLEYLDNVIDWAQAAGMYVVIHFRSGPGRSEAAIHAADNALYTIWSEQAAHDAWVEMWRFTAERYRDSPVVVGYNLMVEPHPNTLIDPDEELDLPEVQAQAEGTLLDWNALAADITTAIRQVDAETPIIVSSINWAAAEWFSVLQPTGDARTIYSLHAYDPDVYTHQDDGEIAIQYPDEVDGYGETITFDRDWLDENYRPAREFAARNNAPIYVGESGIMRWVPDGAVFLTDLTDLFEQYGWNHAYYTWRADSYDWDGFNLEMGVDSQNHTPNPNNPLLALFRERWVQNVNFPGETAAAEPGQTIEQTRSSPSLAEVRHWLYLIDVNLEPETVAQIAASTHDLVVLDFIPSEANNTDYPMAAVMDQLQSAAHQWTETQYTTANKLDGTPSIQIVVRLRERELRSDLRRDVSTAASVYACCISGKIAVPTGFKQSRIKLEVTPMVGKANYPVAYWYDEWSDIWLSPEGLLQGILDAGFDGVFLDWVEAFSDENVIAIAERDGVDSVQEMIWWVGDIAEFGRAQNPNFIVIGQNAAELAVYDDYVEVIDAIAQEQIWYDGSADNDPPGDCALPRTEADVDSDAYRDSLSEACRRQYDEYPQSMLHVSSASYLEQLTLAKDKGLLILTVDYALEPANIACNYETSRELGFIPFVGSRALDRYI